MNRFLGPGAFLACTAALSFSCGPELDAYGQRTDGLGSTTLVISQVFGGGGLSGSAVRSDFVELHNVSASPVALSGVTLQYASAQGSNWSKTDLPPDSIPAGGYYLIALASSGSQGSALSADFTYTTMNIAQADFKMALVRSSNALSGSCPASDSTVVDFIGTTIASCAEGIEGAPSASVNRALTRSGNGCTDSDDNVVDFSLAAPAPRSSASAPIGCVSTPVPAVDAGPMLVRPVLDAGLDDLDAGAMLAVDSGTPPVDAGMQVTPMDAGTPAAADAGRVDAGTPTQPQNTNGGPNPTVTPGPATGGATASGTERWTATNGAGCTAAPVSSLWPAIGFLLMLRRRQRR